jgi:hypothetical protein
VLIFFRAMAICENIWSYMALEALFSRTRGAAPGQEA